MRNLYDYQDLKCNFHTHTTRCKHASGTEREYIEYAIQAGFQVLGFSDHAPYFFQDEHVSKIRMDMNELEDYVKTIEALQKEYQKEIQIFTGLEMEYFPNEFEATLAEIEKFPLDYLILGQHYLKEEKECFYVGRKGTEEVWLETYVNQVITAIQTGKFLYVAHPDIIKYVGDMAIYKKHMRKIAKELKQSHMPVEINVNGCHRKKQYPNPLFVEIAVEEGCDFMIGVDAHAPEELMNLESYQSCMDMVPSKTLKWIART